MREPRIADRLEIADDALRYMQDRAALPPAWGRGIEERREEIRRDAAALGGEPEAVASVEELTAGGIPSRLYRPAGGERDVLVWLHGGAWIIGDLETCDRIARLLANRAGCAVLTVDYRLAPEHRYPAGVDDCWAATAWAGRTFDAVAVGGDSSGGNNAAAVALRARDAGLPLALQVIIYALLDYAAVDGPFVAAFRERYRDFAGFADFGAWHADSVKTMWEWYIPDAKRRLEPDASPLQAASVAGAAPALIITAEHDVLRGEAEDYAHRLAAEGVPVELRDYPRQVHGFFHQPAVMQDARDAIDLVAAALVRAFETPT